MPPMCGGNRLRCTRRDLMYSAPTSPCSLRTHSIADWHSPARIHRCRSRKRMCRCAAERLDYKASGVDIDAGNELVRRIKGINPDIGGFSGLFPFGDSYLVAGTDGVGTKLKLAFELQSHDSIGIDLVAMCVNDIVCCGAKPLFFLDYYATAKLDVDVAERVVRGIQAGCAQCGAVLMGGETAEMPGMYTPGEYDLAGFAVGAVAQDRVVTGGDIAPGDALIGLRSSGVHSNGFSLVRKVLDCAGVSLHDSVPWEPEGGESALPQGIGATLLEPTRIYVNDVLEVHEQVGVKGAVHITGGGFPENLPRALPDGCACKVHLDSYTVPPMFKWLQEAGGIEESEMYRTFNMGVGMVLIVDQDQVQAALEAAPEDAFVLGSVVEGSGVQYV